MPSRLENNGCKKIIIWELTASTPLIKHRDFVT